MLSSITPGELEMLIARDHPQWARQVVQTEAQKYRASMDTRLEPLLRSYLDTGAAQDFRAGEFSAVQLQRLRSGTPARPGTAFFCRAAAPICQRL